VIHLAIPRMSSIDSPNSQVAKSAEKFSARNLQTLSNMALEFAIDASRLNRSKVSRLDRVGFVRRSRNALMPAILKLSLLSAHPTKLAPRSRRHTNRVRRD
jgi:hypothetical protein